ncbi:acetylxylan esterase [Streptomyces sp. NPDC102473]|uniref:acetylxylan esterase n=1 Tax=Streptomyces sp. NPDC102473 TaxID=3366180 RepID=UPI003814AC04
MSAQPVARPPAPVAAGAGGATAAGVPDPAGTGAGAVDSRTTSRGLVSRERPAAGAESIRARSCWKVSAAISGAGTRRRRTARRRGGGRRRCAVLCHFRRASQFTDSGPYAEVARRLSGHRFRVEEAVETLSYFDGINFAARATAPAWFSAGLMDRICPSSTVFAAYHAYAGPAELEVFTYNGHEGGAEYDLPRNLVALRGVFGR